MNSIGGFALTLSIADLVSSFGDDTCFQSNVVRREIEQQSIPCLSSAGGVTWYFSENLELGFIDVNCCHTDNRINNYLKVSKWT